VAAENRSGADEYVQQLVENYVDHDAWFRQKVTASLGNLDRGEFLTHEDVAVGRARRCPTCNDRLPAGWPWSFPIFLTASFGRGSFDASAC